MSTKNESHSGNPLLGVVKKLTPVIIVVFALLSVLALGAVLPKKSTDKAASEAPPVPVGIEVLNAGQNVPDQFVLHGTVEPNRTVMVAAEVSGQIKSYGRRTSDLAVGGKTYKAGQTVKEGEPVSKGDELVLLDTELLQAEYDRAKAQTEYDTREFDRMKQLRDQKVAAQQELDQAETAWLVSKAALAEAAERLKHATIVAPIDGILNDLPEEIGQYVQPGMPVAQIVDTATVKVVVDVPERDVHFLRVGDRPTIFTYYDEDDTIKGEITFISELASLISRTTPVEITIDNSAGRLRSGQIVRAELTRRIMDGVIMVPLAAIIPLEEGYVAYVVEDGRAASRDVKIDMEFISGSLVRVADGLSDGDKLIVSGHRYVADGQKVSVESVTGDGDESESEAGIGGLQP